MKSINYLKENSALNQEKAKLKNNVTNNAQLLLTATKFETDCLKQAGLDHQIKHVKALELEVNRNIQAEEKFKTEIFTVNTIKELCNTYDLNCLVSRRYQGDIPPELNNKIKEFYISNGFVDKEGQPFIRQNSLYILAPAEMFDKLTVKPVNKQPILLFKVGSNEHSSPKDIYEDDRFISIHYWGKGFSFLRTYRYLFSRYKNKYDVVPNINWTLIMIAITVLFLSLNIMIEFYNIKMVFNIVYIILFMIYASIVNSYKNKYLNKLWNI